jgi:hypothetical protein
MKNFLLILLLPAFAAAESPTPEPYCRRMSFDSEVPAGLIGKYEILGKEPETGQTYYGWLDISMVNESYVLRRQVKGQILIGAAWLESCSPDKFMVLKVRYDSKPKGQELSCYLRFDGDNYTRSSCTTSEGSGLEAWYQRSETALP